MRNEEKETEKKKKKEQCVHMLAELCAKVKVDDLSQSPPSAAGCRKPLSTLLHGIFCCPVLCILVELCHIGLVDACNVGHQGVIWVGIRQQRAN